MIFQRLWFVVHCGVGEIQPVVQCGTVWYNVVQCGTVWCYLCRKISEAHTILRTILRLTTGQNCRIWENL